MLAQALRAVLLWAVAQRLLICAHGVDVEKPVEDGLGKVNLALTFKVNEEPVLRRLFENLDTAMTVGDLKNALTSSKLWARGAEVAPDDEADSSDVRVAIVADATDEEVEDDDVTLSTLLQQQQQQQREHSTEGGSPQDQVTDKEGEGLPLFKQGFLQGLSANRRPAEKDVVKLTSIINTTASPFPGELWKTIFSTFNFFKLANTFLRGRGRTLKPLFCFCPLVKAPVCGVDGVTYHNECLLKCKQVKLRHVGSCQTEGQAENPENGGASDRECECPLVDQPVCGTDGKTYASKCVLECLGKTFAHDGKCSSDDQPINVKPGRVCPNTYEPVCSVENKTFRNPCTLKAAEKKLKHSGPCTEEELLEGCGCSKETRLVCGRDGESYTNRCLLDCVEVDFKHDGPCHPAEDDCNCTFQLKPVCGVDGRTYANDCILRCSGIRLAHKGECAERPTVDGPPPCPSDDDPVCGTDGVTYLNRCWASSKGVQVAQKGKCEEQNVCTCPNIEAPVCGVDGVTYRNRCQLDCANVRLAALGRCPDHLCKCPMKYDPVCGVNNVTYRNSCQLRCNNVRPAHKGACGQAMPSAGAARALSSVTREVPQAADDCQCPGPYEPVCGQDNKTYRNICELRCKGVELAYNGECTPDGQICKCTRVWNPVCATNGKTYPNICLLKYDNAVLLHEGKCTKKERKALYRQKSCVCPRVLQPVCGADGRTYSNMCELECEGTKLFHYGECNFQPATPKSCPLRSAEPCQCPDVRSPVCGVDGKTYDNQCELDCACVALKHSGECKIEEKPKCACPQTVDPVCGRDGKTYQNECSMRCADATLLHAGPCSTSKQPEAFFPPAHACVCPFSFEPVCGTDGKTYKNACLATCNRVFVSHLGVCKGGSIPGWSPGGERLCPCPRVRDPVCGVDGKTYSNRCLLKCQEVEFAHYGQCATGKPGNRTCSNYVDPTCGTNNKTYANDCLRHQDGVLLKFRRACHEPEDNNECSCPQERNPVCGRDHKNYNNECEMECKGVELAHRGRCLCPCPRLLDPVCGSDGKTYNNKCLLECEGGIQFLYYGKCASQNACPDTVDPVCSTDVKTYANDCLRFQDGATLLERDSCPNVDPTKVVVTVPNCTCPTDIELVCGVDGRTYLNDCVRSCAMVGLAYKGECRRGDTPDIPEKPECACPPILDPVCGSNGKTYDNKCLMECEGEATSFYYGRCIEKAPRHSTACPDTVEPVCGTNGKTYANDCLRYRDGATLLERDFCRHASPTEVVTMEQNCPCPTTTDFVCGKDGRTYINECVMKYAQVDLFCKGKCKQSTAPVTPKCPCSRILDPVCGSDGKTYDNKCLMECEGTATLLYYGKCAQGGAASHTCPDVIDPVCSTSGQTYKNDCLRYADGAVLQERNPCPRRFPAFCECTRIVAVVCGRDGRTYINRCEMDCRQVSINHTGKCLDQHSGRKSSSGAAFCPTDYIPVCGMDGKTYGNKCLLEEQNVVLKSEGPCQDNEVAVLTSTEQPVCNCPSQYEPVCGVDDNTYPNECVRRCYNVARKHDGQCVGEKR